MDKNSPLPTRLINGVVLFAALLARTEAVLYFIPARTHRPRRWLLPVTGVLTFEIGDLLSPPHPAQALIQSDFTVNQLGDR